MERFTSDAEHNCEKSDGAPVPNGKNPDGSAVTIMSCRTFSNDRWLIV